MLITKYNLSPHWVQLLIFLSVYFFIRSLFMFDVDLNVAECMPVKKKVILGVDYNPNFAEALPELSQSRDQYLDHLEKQVRFLQEENKSLQSTLENTCREIKDLQQQHLFELRALKSTLKENVYTYQPFGELDYQNLEIVNEKVLGDGRVIRDVRDAYRHNGYLHFRDTYYPAYHPENDNYRFPAARRSQVRYTTPCTIL